MEEECSLPVPISPNGSWAEAQRLSWNMWYPWPPFNQTYSNEPGVHIHLVAGDAGVIGSVLNSAVGAVAAIPGLGTVFAAFTGVLGQIVSHLASNADGSMDIYMSAHGFQVGNVPAADPNVWIDGAWAPVAAALNALGSAALPSQVRFAVPHPNSTSHGTLTAQAPL